MPSVTSTLFKDPLLGLPEEDYKHEWVTSTLDKYPHLFKIVTPIRVNNLRHLLLSHPNRPFVESIIAGFQEGFWPAAKADLLVLQKDGFDNCRHVDVLDDVMQGS